MTMIQGIRIIFVVLTHLGGSEKFKNLFILKCGAI
jgi:hypothetical protein